MTGCETQDAAVAAATVADDAPSALLADLPARLRALNRLPRLNGGSEPPDGADRDDDQARRHKGGANSPEAQLAGIPAGDATTTASPRNCADQLVGVPTASATVPGSAGGSIGLGFAIPVDLAKAVADEIIATGRMTHALFGLATVPIPPAAAAQAGLPEGLYVQAVTPGGPAAMAGLRAGDVITTIDGQLATSNVQLQELTLTKKPGDTVSIGYSRTASRQSRRSRWARSREQPTAAGPGRPGHAGATVAGGGTRRLRYRSRNRP